MAQHGAPAVAQSDLNGGSMKRERESVLRREAEPAFEDADVDHHDPRQRRWQQRLTSRDDVVIIVSDSDSDTEDEDEKQNTAPLSSLRTANVNQLPATATPASSTAALPTVPRSLSPAATKATPLLPAYATPPQQPPAPSAAPSQTFASPTPFQARHSTAVHIGNGHKRVAIKLAAAASSIPLRNSSGPAAAHDDMPPLIPPPPPPPPPPPQRPPTSAALLLSAPSTQSIQSLSSDLAHHSAAPQPITGAHAFMSNVSQVALSHIQSANNIKSQYTALPNGAWSANRSSCSTVPVPRPIDTTAPLTLLYSLLAQVVTKPFASYCFACSCALSPSPTSAATSYFSCHICRTSFHSRCIQSCPRHSCAACSMSSGGISSAVQSVSGELYHCLLCPRSFCFAHASSATYCFSSMPAIDRLPAFSPTLLSVLIGAVLRNGDVTSWYASMSTSQIGVCRWCASDLADEEDWRHMQAKRKMRTFTQHT